MVHSTTKNQGGLRLCKGCEDWLSLGSYRVRIDNRDNSTYYSHKCKACERTEAKQRYEEKRLDPAFIVSNRERVNSYRKNNWQVVKEKMKSRRQSEEYKKYVKKYYRKNKNKIRNQHRQVCSNATEALTDWYVVGKINGKSGNLSVQFLKENHPELIAAKRLQLLIHRNIKNPNNGTKKSNQH